MNLDDRTPILVGVGVASQEDDEPGGGLEAVELMVEAARCAAADAGGPRLLGAVQSVAVPQGTWRYADAPGMVARRLGLPPIRTVLAEVGVPQQSLVNDALRRILAGELDVALVVGGEAKRRAVIAERAGRTAAETESGDGEPGERLRPHDPIMAPAEIEAGIWDPVQQYAMIDNALRHAESRSIAEHRDEIARLWAAFNRVAQTNPAAAFPTPRTEQFLARAGPGNRPLAFPYAKWHSSQWAVDQAGALLLCSASAARAHRVPPDRWLFPLVALESSHTLSLSDRRDLHRWPAMAVLGESAARHLGRPLASVEVAELYSCFPAAVRVQQRELGLRSDGVPTTTGGMAFAGGPFNNFTFQATAAVAGRLRAAPGTRGMVTTVSGLLTKPGLMIWSSEPGDRPVLVDDLAVEARARTPVAAASPDHRGPARIVAYTVTYGGELPQRLLAIADTADGTRCVATTDDEAAAELATNEEMIGRRIDVADGRLTLAG